jgi:RNA polymerase sigma-70 factor (ECF subfamily)
MSLIEVGTPSSQAEAFRTVALPHLDAVARVARALAGRGADADDLVQETFLRAYRYWHTYDGESDCRRWLATICRNAYREICRRNERVVAMEDHELESLASARVHIEARTAGVDDMFTYLDVGPAIERAIDALEEHYRQAVLLVDVEGFDYQEVADTLEIPIGTVRSRLYRGRRQLQEALLAYAIDAGYRSANANSD